MTDPDRVATYAKLREQAAVLRCRFIDGTPMWFQTSPRLIPARRVARSYTPCLTLLHTMSHVPTA
jgi:hypothetical protein